MPMALGGGARVVDVLAGAAGALLLDRRAVVVELQGDADHVVAGALASRAAVTVESTPPDMAATIRVPAGRRTASRRPGDQAVASAMSAA